MFGQFEWGANETGTFMTKIYIFRIQFCWSVGYKLNPLEFGISSQSSFMRPMHMKKSYFVFGHVFEMPNFEFQMTAIISLNFKNELIYHQCAGIWTTMKGPLRIVVKVNALKHKLITCWDGVVQLTLKSFFIY